MKNPKVIAEVGCNHKGDIEIAKELNITENTLKTHITSFYNKLGINNKVELINIINSIEKS
jgi:DNA-binding CsgD family transcriptional regulator